MLQQLVLVLLVHVKLAELPPQLSRVKLLYLAKQTLQY